MSAIFGVLGLEDNEVDMIQSVGQEVVFDAAKTALAMASEEIANLYSAFIDRTTESYKMRYLLPGGGRLQRLSPNAPADAVMRYNKWDVAFPLREWGAKLAWSRRALGYMTIKEFDVQLDTIIMQDLNTMRWRVLTAIFEDTNLAFTDEIYGSLTIRRLANTDGSLFPPIAGSESDADDQHYSEAAYNVAAISDANDPIETLRDEVLEHFGGRGSGDRNFVVFHANDSLAKLKALTDYTALPKIFVKDGADTALAVNPPKVPGRVHGYCSGAWLSEWDGWIPDTYMIGLLLEVPAPLMMRVDPAFTGLGTGLQLVAQDSTHPMSDMSWEHVYGLGCGNRLSAAVIEVSGGGATYSPPSAYSE